MFALEIAESGHLRVRKHGSGDDPSASDPTWAVRASTIVCQLFRAELGHASMSAGRRDPRARAGCLARTARGGQSPSRRKLRERLSEMERAARAARGTAIRRQVQSCEVIISSEEFPSPRTRSPLAFRAGGLRRNDLRPRSAPASSAPATSRAALPASPAVRTGRALR